MPALSSALDPRSQEFQDTVAYHRALVDELGKQRQDIDAHQRNRDGPLADAATRYARA